MKYLTIYHRGNKIEIFNNLLGKETIKVNDEEVSSKYSIMGAEHPFKLTENGVVFDSVIKIKFGLNGLVIDFFADGEPIIEAPKGSCLRAILIFILVVIVIGLLKAIF